MNNTFPTLQEIHEARRLTAPLSVQQMVDRIAVSVRDSIKRDPHSTFIVVKFPEFGSCNDYFNLDFMFNEVIRCTPDLYKCDWLWVRELQFTVRWP